jgi:hypothetical protein
LHQEVHWIQREERQEEEICSYVHCMFLSVSLCWFSFAFFPLSRLWSCSSFIFLLFCSLLGKQCKICFDC